MRGRLPSVFVAALLAGGCGYRLGIPLPEGRGRIAVPIFENRTFYREIEGPLTQKVMEELLAREDVRLTGRHEADAVLTGTITHFSKQIVREDVRDQVAEFSILVVVDIRFQAMAPDGFDRAWTGIPMTETYLVSKGQDEIFARDEAFRKLARRVVDLILGWQ